MKELNSKLPLKKFLKDSEPLAAKKNSTEPVALEKIRHERKPVADENTRFPIALSELSGDAAGISAASKQNAGEELSEKCRVEKKDASSAEELAKKEAFNLRRQLTVLQSSETVHPKVTESKPENQPENRPSYNNNSVASNLTKRDEPKATILQSKPVMKRTEHLTASATLEVLDPTHVVSSRCSFPAKDGTKEATSAVVSVAGEVKPQNCKPVSLDVTAVKHDVVLKDVVLPKPVSKAVGATPLAENRKETVIKDFPASKKQQEEMSSSSEVVANIFDKPKKKTITAGSEQNKSESDVKASTLPSKSVNVEKFMQPSSSVVATSTSSTTTTTTAVEVSNTSTKKTVGASPAVDKKMAQVKAIAKEASVKRAKMAEVSEESALSSSTKAYHLGNKLFIDDADEVKLKSEWKKAYDMKPNVTKEPPTACDPSLKPGSEKITTTKVEQPSSVAVLATNKVNDFATKAKQTKEKEEEVVARFKSKDSKIKIMDNSKVATWVPPLQWSFTADKVIDKTPTQANVVRVPQNVEATAASVSCSPAYKSIKQKNTPAKIIKAGTKRSQSHTNNNNSRSSVGDVVESKKSKPSEAEQTPKKRNNREELMSSAVVSETPNKYARAIRQAQKARETRGSVNDMIKNVAGLECERNEQRKLEQQIIDRQITHGNSGSLIGTACNEQAVVTKHGSKASSCQGKVNERGVETSKSFSLKADDSNREETISPPPDEDMQQLLEMLSREAGVEIKEKPSTRVNNNVGGSHPVENVFTLIPPATNIRPPMNRDEVVVPPKINVKPTLTAEQQHQQQVSVVDHNALLDTVLEQALPKAAAAVASKLSSKRPATVAVSEPKLSPKRPRMSTSSAQQSIKEEPKTGSEGVRNAHKVAAESTVVKPTVAVAAAKTVVKPLLASVNSVSDESLLHNRTTSTPMKFTKTVCDGASPVGNNRRVEPSPPATTTNQQQRTSSRKRKAGQCVCIVVFLSF